MERVNVRSLHKPLADAGLIPENCRLMEVSIGLSGGLLVRYEVYLDPSQTVALGRILQAVGNHGKDLTAAATKVAFDHSVARAASTVLTGELIWHCSCGRRWTTDPKLKGTPECPATTKAAFDHSVQGTVGTLLTGELIWQCSCGRRWTTAADLKGTPECPDKDYQDKAGVGDAP